MFRRVLVACLLLCTPFGVAAAPFHQRAAPPKSSLEVTTRTRGGGPKEISKKTAVAAGMILAFNSGYSNGCCLGGGVSAGVKNNAVAAVTGAWTTSALGMAQSGMAGFLPQAKGILSYMSGSAIAGAMIPRPQAFVLSDNTGPTFLVGAALMYAASQIAEKSPSSMTYFYLALMANGLQNSVTSVHTANLCRSAHFSGITSDMGTFLGQCLMGNKENLFKLKVFALLGLSFWLGGYSSFFVTQQMASESLLFSAFVHACVGGYLMIKQHDLSGERPFVLDYEI